MISTQAMQDIVVDQRLRRVHDSALFVLTHDPRPTNRGLFQVVTANCPSPALRGFAGPGDAEVLRYDEFVSRFDLAVPEQRISEGFYRHRAAGPDDVYYVKGVGILDENGHGDPDAPRHVFYESTRSRRPAHDEDRDLRENIATSPHDVYLGNIRSEAEFGQLVKWPDGIVRPRFVRMEYSK